MCFISRKERAYFDQNSARGGNTHFLPGKMTAKDEIKAEGGGRQATQILAIKYTILACFSVGFLHLKKVDNSVQDNLIENLVQRILHSVEL